MKRILLFSAFFFLLKLSKAQNLVPNPGFEIYTETNDTNAINTVLRQGRPNGVYIPNNYLSYDFFSRECPPWHGPKYGILRNRCWDSLGYIMGKLVETLTFENAYDTAHLTHSGMSCANLFIRDDPNRSSYISVSLNDTLCEGCEYAISFYIYITQASNVIFNNIGLVSNPFMNDENRSRVDDKSDASKYYLKSNTQLKQGVWQKLQYHYIAKGDEYCIAIGKYKSKERIKVLRKNEKDYAMSIYIDDVVMEKVMEEPLDPGN